MTSKISKRAKDAEAKDLEVKETEDFEAVPNVEIIQPELVPNLPVHLPSDEHLAEEDEALPDYRGLDGLTFSQVAYSVSLPPGMPPEEAYRYRDDAVGLYRNLHPTDALESVLVRTLVGLNNAVMESFERAAYDRTSSGARDVNLRHAMKGASVLSELAKTLDNRRGIGRQPVTVGQVKIESGGQAIVGNVDHSSGPERIPQRNRINESESDED